jgi:regulator of nucleoside diphosphate kinase
MKGTEMLIDTRYINTQISEPLLDLARRRIERALRPFQESVERADVCIEGVIEAHGAEGVRCSITIQLAGAPGTVVVTSMRTDADEAVRAACRRLAGRVSRALSRRLARDRVSPSRPPAVPSGTAVPRPGSDAPVEETRIQVTTADHQRLQSLLDTGSGIRDRDAAEQLADELDRADVVPPQAIASSVVTMNSRVLFEDEQTGATRVVSLVYPQESDVAQGKISILAPVGSALLGLTVGQKIDWPLPRGQTKRLRIVKVLYQPEDAGHFHL